MTRTTHNAFFYGTLMAPEVLYRVCFGTATPPESKTQQLMIQPAILHDFCRHRVRNCDYPAILPDAGHTVRGTFVSGLSQSDVWRLDVFEGDEYARKPVTVKALSKIGDESGEGNIEGEALEAETYIWIAGEDKLEKREWDFGEFRKEKLSRWAGSSKEYQDVDEAVRAQGTDPTGGRGLDGHITQQLNEEAAKDILGSAV
ncbi:hypothetical protein L228DRAFT_250000 [Xylona heveae TC161]|uniref:Putative gamma-glutamylcyclotransferase n=1 Tax=Xylona heveae (strain CBS 132557 / TC161) TaxID=1328760 RepID=A0A165AE30_XYLHT|nr:hypothetical protein L228DRAFT_250000 [Xylona heveae TC161]KZF20325.1 hypothetical protein L228DRAFT_250000 [Xylona heveae TC161]